MAATTTVNFMTVVHKDSGGMAMFMPDVCKTPMPPAGPVPIPYPNITMSSDTSEGSKKVMVDGNPVMLQGSVFSKSSGDEAGSLGGIVSGCTKGKAEFINYSFDVKFEGKSVPRLGDMMLGNKGSAPNTPPMAEVQPPAVVIMQDLEAEQLNKEKKTTVFRIKVVEHLSWDNYDREKPEFRLNHKDNKPIAGKKVKIKITYGEKTTEVEKTTDDKGIIELTDQKPFGIYEVIFESEDPKFNNKYCFFYNGKKLVAKKA